MADITELRGNIFTTRCDVLVVTVNCVGDMGAGIALEARYRYPEMAAKYREICEAGQLQPGKLWLWTESEPAILCFPTKKHWRNPSKMSYVTAGLDKLASTYKERGITSLAMPHLGASHGGLNWADVRVEVLARLGDLPDLRLEIYEFDPNAVDPSFDELRMRFDGVGPGVVSEQLELRPQASRILLDVLAHPDACNLSALHRAPGFGEKSLEAVYRFLFSGTGPPSQQLRFGVDDV